MNIRGFIERRRYRKTAEAMAEEMVLLLHDATKDLICAHDIITSLDTHKQYTDNTAIMMDTVDLINDCLEPIDKMDFLIGLRGQIIWLTNPNLKT